MDSWSDLSRLTTTGNYGESTDNMDLGFSLYYFAEDIKTNPIFIFNYGIVALEADANIQNAAVNKNTTPITTHKEQRDIWIQSGCDAGDGMYITTGEMNTKVLGINGVNVSTQEGALQAIDAVDGALQKVMEMRSRIGAQQNRLEHTIANEENIVENTTAAESRIRDTDMAREMVKYSLNNILAQAGQSMLAQANQAGQGVLTLLGN